MVKAERRKGGKRQRRVKIWIDETKKISRVATEMS